MSLRSLCSTNKKINLAIKFNCGIILSYFKLNEGNMKLKFIPILLVVFGSNIVLAGDIFTPEEDPPPTPPLIEVNTTNHTTIL